MNSNTLTLHKSDYFPHQWEFLKSGMFGENKNKSVSGFIGGMGSGKTHSFIAKTALNHFFRKNKDGISNGWIIYPTYALAEEVFVPKFLEILEKKNISYDYNVSKHTIKSVYGNIRIFQMVKPQSIIGVSLSYCGFDEFDVSSYKYCETAFNKAIGRMRDCDNPEIYITSTPEGFKFSWELFEGDRKDDSKFYVKGRTKDNFYLPKTYIKLLEQNYDSKLLKAYSEGEWVNIQQGQTYYQFNRDTNIQKVQYNRSLPVRMGIDWNVSPECCVLFNLYKEQPQIRIFDCISLTHAGAGDLLTERMVKTVKEKYPNSEYIAYPDATGHSRGTSAMYSDIDLLIQGGFKVKALKSNPLVIDRVNAVNKALDGNLVIDPKCKELINDLEKTANKEGTREIDKSNNSLTHMSDALGYAVHWELPIIKPTLGSIRRI